MKWFRIFILILFVFLPLISRAQVYINEIMYEPQGTDANAGGEWIEVKNVGTENIDLSKWKFFDSVGNTSNHTLTFVQGPQMLSPDQYAVITKDLDAFKSFFSQFSGLLFKSSFTLSVDSTNKEETLIIRNSDLVDIDSVIYSSNQGANGDGNSLQKSGSTWFVGVPTLGLINTTQSIPLDNSNTTASTTTTSGSSDTSASGNTSAHSSPAPLSDIENKIDFEISAGRDRLTSVGSSVTFAATPTKLQNITEQNVTYGWSFGDGTVGQGINPNHSYKFAGEYAVVVNAFAVGEQAVSRLNVRVVSPDFSLTRVSGGVEISNKSGTEVNLEGWILKSEKKTFTFPKDTLIPAGKRVTFADEITGMDFGSVDLVNPMQKSFATLSPVISQSVSGVSVSTTSSNLENIQVKIDEVKTTLAKISPVQKVVTPVVTITKPSAPLVSEPVLAEASSSQSTNVATVFEATKQTGFVGSIFSWPIKGFNFIMRLFVED